MTKRDLLTPLGITLGFAMIMVAIMSNSGSEGISSFADISSIFIVLGGLTASMLITFKMEQIRLTKRVLKEAFLKSQRSTPELIQLFIQLSDRARREGILALENELDEVEDPFIRKGMMLAVDGVEPEVITDILNAEIIAMEDRHYKGRQLIEKAAEYAPAWGMIGTLIGLVLMLNKLAEPASLGPSMAVALLTTLYGTVLANLFFTPMAGKLESKTEEEVFIRQIIIEGVIGVQSGQNPRILEEKLSAFLTEEDMQTEKNKTNEKSYAGEKLNEA
ncbi:MULTISPECIES: flagellar motor protein MotP [Oceanobacillus]|uniref:MotA/TolQ/ExbB proton channel domain-containing protein n=1 Tax=Oceanobacillus kimchii TaxID=746691 RepID=A0ABQ5TK88_9BACI|nr:MULTISPECIES: flagellar motor protein MotP [Oceanobacillus]MBT2600776.1 flagellar motor protein MotP [Oceanobacillus sp. ISL-74]MBT2650827.1 flagellar motor protein MotP [Oceanobacillus sp. ISL-73]MCT1575531.1 flagellar motor protein MotP [Oceanobacillus kimchii]MCT2137162.1 flagellar motor protein MotP [Oceanobacillus kimchii]OEH55347.1 flagellar motor protein MotP [Oceanobacillus sp. E9]